MRWTIGAGLVLAGCTGGNGLLGDDIGVPLDRGDPVSLTPGAPSLEAQPTPDFDNSTGSNGVFTGTCHDLAEAIPTPAMTAEGGQNVILVEHFGVPAGDPADFTITGTVGNGEIVMIYESPTSETPTCNWKLEYTIYGLSAGTWTVRALDDAATATVTGDSW